MMRIIHKINIAVLCVCVLAFLLLPLKKGIWYDESVTILCSQGINYESADVFNKTQTITSRDINALNTAANVYQATLMDNSNSYLYNMGLHYFTLTFGKNLDSYEWFSRIWGIGSLVALFFLAQLLFGESIAVSISIALLFTDLTFWGMANEVRAYMMGLFFVILSAYYFFRYYLQPDNTVHLLLFSLFGACAMLCHFFAAYAIVAFAIALLLKFRGTLFTFKNTVSLGIPCIIVATYFFIAHSGLSAKNIHTIVVDNKDRTNYSLAACLSEFARFSSVGFRMFLSRIYESPVINYGSLLLVVALYMLGVGLLASKKTERNKYHILFWAGMSGSLFLLIISIKNHTLSSFYYRYFLFCYPFCCLFIAHFIKLLGERYHKVLCVTAGFAFTAPAIYFFIAGIRKANSKNEFNHIAIANIVSKEHINSIAVPTWNDALLVQSLLNSSVEVTYRKDSVPENIIIYRAHGEESIKVLRNNP